MTIQQLRMAIAARQSQSDVAKESGVDQAVISRITTGARDPRASTMKKLQDYFVLQQGYRFEVKDGYECVCVPIAPGDK